MAIVNPLASSNVVIQAATTVTRPEERQNDLRIEQIVRATVVEGGLDKALLDLKGRRILIQSEQELQTGQKLQLQVLTTYPKLSFKLLAAPLEERLALLLPLLAKPFNWDSLTQQVQQGTNPQSEAMKQTLEKLSTFLRSPTDVSTQETAKIASTLSQLKTYAELFSGTNGPALAASLDRMLTALNWKIESPDLSIQLKSMAVQFRHQPELMSEIPRVGQEKIAGLLKQIDQTLKPLQPEQVRHLAAELKNLLSTNPAQLTQLIGGASQSLPFFLPAQANNLELSPAILGHMKALADHLELAVAEKPIWPQDLRQLVQQVLVAIQPLVSEPEILTQSGNLGLLSQLFGLNLEAELLRGKTKDALNNLKSALLGERTQLGPKGEEALHRLELFQICRVRLAEQNQTFVPLPLPFLEEGFLLVEEHSPDNHQETKDGERTRLSLHLKLSSLGNLRIDMLSESSGMLLRVACEDQQRMDFLQSLNDQLQKRLEGLNIRGISFTTGAETPASELLKKLLPTAHGVLDARV